MSRTKTDRTNRAIFGARFSEQLKKWQSAGENKTQEDFGQLLDPPASRVSVNKWCAGKDIPRPERLKQICEIFGVEEDFFDTTDATHDELYEHSGAFQTKIGKSHVEFAKRINLNLDLVEALSRIVDFNNLFPLYSPIYREVKPGVYDRKVNFKKSASMEKDNDLDKDLQFLQVEQNGKRITFHRCDLAFLKEVQDQIATFTEYLFYRRKKEMSEEVEKFNQDLIEITVDGKPIPDSEREKYLDIANGKPKIFDSPGEFEKTRKAITEKASGHENVCISLKEITEKYILDHDRFAKYFEEIIPTTRDATQEDLDRIFGGDITLDDGGKAEMKKGVK